MIDKNRWRSVADEYLRASVVFDLAIFKVVESLIAADELLASKYAIVAGVSLLAYLTRARQRADDAAEKTTEVAEEAADKASDVVDDVADAVDGE